MLDVEPLSLSFTNNFKCVLHFIYTFSFSHTKPISCIYKNSVLLYCVLGYTICQRSTQMVLIKITTGGWNAEFLHHEWQEAVFHEKNFFRGFTLTFIYISSYSTSIIYEIRASSHCYNSKKYTKRKYILRNMSKYQSLW